MTAINVPSIVSPSSDGIPLPKPSADDIGDASGLKLTLGYTGAAWRFADGVLAYGVFANGCGLVNRLRTREVRGNRGSHKRQGSSPHDHEFQHPSLQLSLGESEIT
jgi:hypothetical protein